MGNEDFDHSEDASLESSSIIHWSIELKKKMESVNEVHGSANEGIFTV